MRVKDWLPPVCIGPGTEQVGAAPGLTGHSRRSEDLDLSRGTARDILCGCEYCMLSDAGSR